MMKKQASFLIIKGRKTLDQIRSNEFNTVAKTLAKTSLKQVDFERIERTSHEDHHTIVREYMLLKTGMFESWEILYN